LCDPRNGELRGSLRSKRGAANVSKIKWSNGGRPGQAAEGEKGRRGSTFKNIPTGQNYFGRNQAKGSVESKMAAAGVGEAMPGEKDHLLKVKGVSRLKRELTSPRKLTEYRDYVKRRDLILENGRPKELQVTIFFS